MWKIMEGYTCKRRENDIRPGPEKCTKQMKDGMDPGSWPWIWKDKIQDIFPLMITTKRPDLILWNTEWKIGILIEMTVLWEENIANAK